ncbi:hypothetical protein [Novosphingobium indicum]|uniref:hypothetical protein n=1 Tax=Novosphingobium indicum TaxID=462949 RepID=UPI001663FFCD|nr:hypothetical protein [Novosphingobium indicum]
MRKPIILWLFAALWFAGAIGHWLLTWHDGDRGIDAVLFEAGLLAVLLIVFTKSHFVRLIYTIVTAAVVIFTLKGVWESGIPVYQFSPIFLVSLILDVFSLLALWTTQARKHIHQARGDWIAGLATCGFLVLFAPIWFGIFLLTTLPDVFFVALYIAVAGSAFVAARLYFDNRPSAAFPHREI